MVDGYLFTILCSPFTVHRSPRTLGYPATAGNRNVLLRFPFFARETNPVCNLIANRV